MYENIECGWNIYCNTDECDVSGEIYLTQPENLSYDSNLKECTVINELENEYNPLILSEVSYYASDDLENALTSAPSQIGTYVAKLNLINTDNSIISVASLTFEIVLPNITGISIKNYSGTYDGNLHGIDVSIPDGANIVYSTDNINWTAESPTYKEVGVYTVYYKVTKDNHNDYLGSATVTIKKKTTTTSSKTYYNINIMDIENGRVESNLKKAFSHSVVTLTITPDEGYELILLNVSDKKGGTVKLTNKNNNQYTFVMPASKVEVNAVFKEVENPFIDICETDWFYEAVMFASQNKLFNGLSENKFGPTQNMTRGMLVTVLYRHAKANVNEEAKFNDVDKTLYYNNPIAWAAKNGIVNGIGNNQFAPESEVTREQIVSILYRYAIYMNEDVVFGKNTNILSYDDFSEISEYAIPAFQWACDSGIITGRTMSTLVPNAVEYFVS